MISAAVERSIIPVMNNQRACPLWVVSLPIEPTFSSQIAMPRLHVKHLFTDSPQLQGIHHRVNRTTANCGMRTITVGLDAHPVPFAI